MTDTLSSAMPTAPITPERRMSWPWRFLHAATFAFVIVLVALVSCLLYVSWHTLPELLRTFILTGSSSSTFALTIWLRKRNGASLYTILAGAVALYCFIADITGLIQLFNVEPSTGPLLFCTAFAFLLAFSLQSRWLLAIALIGAIFYAWTWVGGDLSTFQLYSLTIPSSWHHTYMIPEIFLPSALLTFLASFVPSLNRFPGFAALFRTFAFIIVFAVLLLFFENVQRYVPLANMPDEYSTIYSCFGIPVTIFEQGCFFVGLLLSLLAIWQGLRRKWLEVVNIGIIFLALPLSEMALNFFLPALSEFGIAPFAACFAAAITAMILLHTINWGTALTMVILVGFLFVTVRLTRSLDSEVDVIVGLVLVTLLFFLLIIPLWSWPRNTNDTAKLSQHYVAWAGAILIVFANAYVATKVIWNRSGEPDSVLTLSERELFIPGSVSLARTVQKPVALNWRYPVEEYPNHAWKLDTWEATWLNSAKMAELGFAVPKPEPTEGALREIRRPTAKEVLLVLEFEGPAWHKALEAATAADARMAARTASLPIESHEANYQPYSLLFKEQNLSSRLFVVDAGLDQTALREKYPDRRHYSIVHGMVQPTSTQLEIIEFQDESVAGIILGFDVNTIEQFADFNKSCKPNGVYGYYVMFGLGDDASSVAPCSATIAFGKRLEPWIVDALPRNK